MTSRESGQLTGSDRSGHDRDVFGICKERMSDPADKSFKPVLVLPYDLLGQAGSYTDIPVLPRKPVSHERAKVLGKLAQILEGTPYNNVEGAASLRKLATCEDWKDEPKEFSFFLQDPEVVPAALPAHSSEHFAHLPKVCRPMMAKFGWWFLAMCAEMKIDLNLLWSLLHDFHSFPWHRVHIRQYAVFAGGNGCWCLPGTQSWTELRSAAKHKRCCKAQGVLQSTKGCCKALSAGMHQCTHFFGLISRLEGLLMSHNCAPWHMCLTCLVVCTTAYHTQCFATLYDASSFAMLCSMAHALQHNNKLCSMVHALQHDTCFAAWQQALQHCDKTNASLLNQDISQAASLLLSSGPWSSQSINQCKGVDKWRWLHSKLLCVVMWCCKALVDSCCYVFGSTHHENKVEMLYEET